MDGEQASLIFLWHWRNMIPADLPPTMTVHQTKMSDPIADSLSFVDHVSMVVANLMRAKEEAKASRYQNRESPSMVGGPSSLPAGLLCVRDHESRGNYTIVNQYGYQGAYQMSPEYAPAWAQRYGYGDWANVPVIEWPPAVQDGVALGLWNDGATVWKNWAPYTCDWPS